MHILLVNDDGASAPGLKSLLKVVSPLGKVVCVAPDYERSGCGHGMTLRDPLRATRVETINGTDIYEVNGLPVDCVNVAVSQFFPNGCDLVISGINNGPNLGWDVTYSGTVAAAMEGTINGIRSIAVSVSLFVTDAPLHFETAESWLGEWLSWLIDVPLPEQTFLNINVPSIALPEIQGTKITRLGTRVYHDRVEKREDPWGRPYYWQGGVVVVDNSEVGTDVWAVSEGYVSITPIRLDWTHTEIISDLQLKLPKK